MAPPLMADQQDQDQKTEAPTGKRLDEAREHGQLPVSREAAHWVSMLGILTVMGLVVPAVAKNLGIYLRRYFELAHTYTLDENNIQAFLFNAMAEVGMIVGVAFLLMMAAIIAGFMVQTGFFFALDLLTPDFARLSPAKGLKKLFSIQSLVEFGKSIGKLILMGGIAYSILMPVIAQSRNFTGMPIDQILVFLQHKVVYLIEMLLLVFTGIAAVDLFFTRFQYIKNLRMTKTEVKDEFKQQEGDPMIKSRLRQLRAEKARKRMMAQVPKADVVITNPSHYAVALQYDNKKMPAPIVIAKGMNLIAERIRAVAEENKVPLVSNPPLARALFDTVEVDQQIPAQHYRAVAEVISYLYRLRKRRF